MGPLETLADAACSTTWGPRLLVAITVLAMCYVLYRNGESAS